jgi:uncharacterized protein (TIGR00369 family)
MAADGEAEEFGGLVGLRTEEMGAGTARVVLDATERHLNGHGTVHGGAIATLVDVAMGMAVVVADAEAFSATIEMKLTYLEPGQLGEIVAVATVRRKGRRISIVEAEVTQGDELLALALSTFAV